MVHTCQLYFRPKPLAKERHKTRQFAIKYDFTIPVGPHKDKRPVHHRLSNKLLNAPKQA